MGYLLTAIMETVAEPIKTVEDGKLVEMDRYTYISRNDYIRTINSLAESIKRYNEEDKNNKS